MISINEITRYMELNKKAKTGKLVAGERAELVELKELYNKSLAENEKDAVDDKDVLRINELSKKHKTVGLSAEEEKEFVTLRLAYVLSYKRNVANQVNNIDIVDKDGTVENLGEKYGKNN